MSAAFSPLPGERAGVRGRASASPAAMVPLIPTFSRQEKGSALRQIPGRSLILSLSKDGVSLPWFDKLTMRVEYFLIFAIPPILILSLSKDGSQAP